MKRIIFLLTEAQQAAPVALQASIMYQNLYYLLKKLKTRHVFYDGNEIHINERLRILSKNIMAELEVSMLTNPLFDKAKMLDVAFTVIDDLWLDNESVKKIDALSIVKFFIYPLQVILINDPQEVQDQRMAMLASTFLKIITTPAWVKIDPLFQQMGLKLAATLLKRDCVTFKESELDALSIVIRELFRYKLKGDSLFLLNKRNEQHAKHPEAALYYNLYILFAFLYVLPTDVDEQTLPEVLQAHIDCLYEPLRVLNSRTPLPITAFYDACSKFPANFLSKQLPEFKALLKERFLENTFFLKKSIEVLHFVEIHNPDTSPEAFVFQNTVVLVAKILSCDDGLIAEFGQVQPMASPSIEKHKVFNASNLLSIETEVELILTKLSDIAKGSASFTKDSYDFNLWLMIASVYLQNKTRGQEIFLALFYANVMRLLQSSNKPQRIQSMLLESKTNLDSMGVDTHIGPSVWVHDQQILIDSIKTALAQINGSGLRQYLYHEQKPIDLILDKLLTWFIVNEHHFDLPSEVKALFLKMIPSSVWQNQFLAYWHHLFELEPDEAETMTLDNEFATAHQTILTGATPESSLPFDGHLTDLKQCFQIKLFCEFLKKHLDDIPTHFDAVLEKAYSYAKKGYFPAIPEDATTLNVINVYHDTLKNFQRGYQFKPGGVQPRPKHFVSIEDNLSLLKYLSLVVYEKGPAADFALWEKKFVYDNCVAFISDMEPLEHLDKKAFYTLNTKILVSLHKDPEVKTNTSINFTAYINKLLEHGLVLELQNVINVISMDPAIVKTEWANSDKTQIWFLGALFQYTAYTCKFIAAPIKLIIRDESQFILTLNKINDGFLNRFLPDISRKQLVSKLITILTAYPQHTEAQALCQALQNDTSLQENAEKKGAVVVAEGEAASKPKKKKKKKGAKGPGLSAADALDSEGTETSPAPANESRDVDVIIGAPIGVAESQTVTPDNSQSTVLADSQATLSADFDIQSTDVSSQTSVAKDLQVEPQNDSASESLRFFSQRLVTQVTLNTEPVYVPEQVIIPSLRLLVNQLSRENPDYEFGLYGLRVWELALKSRPFGEYSLCISIPELNLPEDLEKLIESLSRCSVVTYWLSNNNKLTLTLKDIAGFHRLNIYPIKHRPKQIVYDCIDSAKYNPQALCMLMGTAYQDQYPVYGPEKCIANLAEGKLCMVKEPERRLYMTDFPAFFELMYLQLRYPKCEKDKTLNDIVNDKQYLRECFNHFRATDPQATEKLYDGLLMLFSQFPMTEVIKIMDKSGFLDAIAGISGTNITKTLRLMAPYEHVENPHIKVRGFCLYMATQFCCLAQENIKLEPEIIERWPLNDLLNFVLRREPGLKNILMSWALGQDCKDTTKDENFLMLRDNIGRFHGCPGNEAIGREESDEPELEAVPALS